MINDLGLTSGNIKMSLNTNQGYYKNCSSRLKLLMRFPFKCFEREAHLLI